MSNVYDTETRPIPGYNGRYVISKAGTLYYVRNESIHEMAVHKTRGLYYLVNLTMNGIRKTYSLHRLVALTWLPVPENNNMVVNHKNGNKECNHSDNLEYISQRDNCKHAIATGLTNSAIKPVMQYTKDGTFISEFRTISEASQQLHIGTKTIRSACNGNIETAGGFKWSFKKKITSVIADTTEWKTINVDPTYKISTSGVVYSTKSKKYLSPITINGRLFVSINISGVRRNFAISRLVAFAYIPNPLDKKVVNHINGNPLDNTVSNLEWVTHSENTKHAHKTGLIKYKTNEVIQYTIEGVEVACFKSISDAILSTHVNKDGIRNCCNGKSKTCGGFIWKYRSIK